MERASRWFAWAKFANFLSCQSTVSVLSILSMTSGVLLSCQALYISVTAEASHNLYTANLLNTLGQNVLLVLSLYVLVLPFLRGTRLHNGRIWFVVSFSIGAVAGVCSVVILRWAPQVSAFLANLANAAQVLATLLLFQGEPMASSIPESLPGE
jgi:hypothetical protein